MCGAIKSHVLLKKLILRQHIKSYHMNQKSFFEYLIYLNILIYSCQQTVLKMSRTLQVKFNIETKFRFSFSVLASKLYYYKQNENTLPVNCNKRLPRNSLKYKNPQNRYRVDRISAPIVAARLE